MHALPEPFGVESVLPTTTCAKSCSAASTTRGHPLPSPIPVMPASVSTFTKSQLRVPLVTEALMSAAQPETPGGPACIRKVRIAVMRGDLTAR
jgi:hypothetical protein